MTAPAFHASICAHSARLDKAVRLLETIGGVLTLDLGDRGATPNHIQAWEEAYESNTIGAEWLAVIEDDAQPEPFIHQDMGLILAEAPTPIVSGYLGTGRPPQYQHLIADAMELEPTWIVCDELLHHVAVFVRTELVPSLIESMKNRPSFPCDEAVSVWAQNNGHPVGYPVPSPFDHEDGVPVIADELRSQPICEARRAWSVGSWSMRDADRIVLLDQKTRNRYGSRFKS